MNNFPGVDTDPKILRTLARCDALGAPVKTLTGKHYNISTLRGKHCLKRMTNSQTGGHCSLCGACGTNKTTCPRNPVAKHPDASKHSQSGGTTGQISAIATLKLTPTPYDSKLSRERKQTLLKKKKRINEIITDSLLGFDVKRIKHMDKGTAEVHVVTTPDFTNIYGEESTQEAVETFLKDNYGNGAADSWMEGDIEIVEGVELYIDLKKLRWRK